MRQRFRFRGRGVVGVGCERVREREGVVAGGQDQLASRVARPRRQRQGQRLGPQLGPHLSSGTGCGRFTLFLGDSKPHLANDEPGFRHLGRFADNKWGQTNHLVAVVARRCATEAHNGRPCRQVSRADQWSALLAGRGVWAEVAASRPESSGPRPCAARARSLPLAAARVATAW